MKRILRQLIFHSLVVLSILHSGMLITSAAETDNAYIDEIIFSTALELNIDPFLIRAIIKAESDFNPRAVSDRGAVGLMQLMPATASDMGVQDPFDPEQNIQGGAKYIHLLLEKYEGDIVLALAAYNAGPARVKDSVPNFPETYDYIEKVSRTYKKYVN